MLSIVNKDKAYVIHYCIKNRQGNILEASPESNPLTFYPGDGSVLKVIEDAVVAAGDTTKINLTILPQDAFGIYDASLIFKVRRRAFLSNEPLKLHQSIYANTPKGKKLVKIIDITTNTVTVNGNHELAGKTLYVDINIITK
ncbi:MAG: peptidylprolyl isomerase [Thiohalomonadales bacterium]